MIFLLIKDRTPMKMKEKKLAITIGDPAGIGPEVVLKSLHSQNLRDLCRFVLIGDLVVIERAAEEMRLPYEIKDYEFIDMKIIRDQNFERNKPSSLNGKASVSYVMKAIELAMKGYVDAIVTAPISKESWGMAGFKWPGHTEMLAELTGVRDYAMVFYSDVLKIILVTIHEAIRDVPGLIKKERVFQTIQFANKACNMMGIDAPRIGVAGLNPHAGEGGIFGDEEIKEILPAINDALESGISVSGPHPPDAIFHKAYKGEFDIVVCMYHDQGLIPLKMIAFERSVNITMGLPVIRTSPDHGTAYDIAWKGIADPSSMIEAIRLAVRLSQ
jgi:4-hydroxythreonine-4-phosphate dehydrogenase